MLMRIPDDLRDPRQGSDLMGRALRVTSGDDDASVRIFTMHTPDGSAGVLIRRSRDCAGVQHANLCGVGPGGSFQTARFELALDCGAVRLGGPAAKILYVVRRHHTIVAAL